MLKGLCINFTMGVHGTASSNGILVNLGDFHAMGKWLRLISWCNVAVQPRYYRN